ncbi:MAG TPA: AarF/ABC1/UbiB kinase family protein [Herpetosiphonaceae bacterium]
MWPIVRQVRYFRRYRQIAWVLTRHGFGALATQLGLRGFLSWPARLLRRPLRQRLSAPARLRLVLIALGPTFVKLGQILSTRPDLFPAPYIEELSRLQDTVPPFPSEQAIALVEEELGRPIDELFAAFEPVPLAAASLGQVHAATLHSGESVVVKIQRPDIKASVTTDLAILNELAGLAQEQTVLGQRYKLVDLAWEFGATLREELDYRREARNAERFRQNFRGIKTAYIPIVYHELTSERVLTSERLYGVKINDLAGLDAAGMDRVRVARHSAQLILKEVFSDGFFHADPHPGNFFVLPNEVIGAIDFGMVGTLDRDSTQGLVRLLLALAQDDMPSAVRALEQLHIVSRRNITPAMRRDLRRLMDRLVDRSLADISARETGDALLALVQRHELTMPAPLALLLKTLAMMEGTGLQLDPNLDVFGIVRPYAARAILDLNSPLKMGGKLLDDARSALELAGELPRNLNDALRMLAEGELTFKVANEEVTFLARELGRAANRLAEALLIAAFVIGLLGVLIAVDLGGWTGFLPTLLSIGAVLSVLVLGALLLIGMLRSGR